MSGPQRTQLATVSTVTPTLTDKAIVSQTNTVKASTFQSIYNLFKTGYDTVYTTTAAVAAQITAALTNYVTNSSLASTLTGYVTSSQLSTTLTTLPQVASVTINNVSISTLNSIPIQIVPTPGANKAIQVLSCIVNFENTQSDDYISNTQLQLIEGFSGDIIALSRTDFLGGILATYSQYLIMQQAASQLTNQIVSNSNIKLSVVGGNPIPNGSPDVTLKVYVVYQVINL
jgi:hypothetical protein